MIVNKTILTEFIFMVIMTMDTLIKPTRNRDNHDHYD